MIKINRAEFLSALLCAATRDVRYYLNGVCVDSEGFVVATDGHRMFVGKATTDQETVIFSLKGKVPAKFDHVVIYTDDKSAVFVDKNCDAVQTTPIEVIDGRFPDWRRVSSYKEGKISAIGLDLQYLNDAAKAAKYFGKRRARIDMQDAGSAVHIQLADGAFMIVMPTRL